MEHPNVFVGRGKGAEIKKFLGDSAPEFIPV